MINTYLKLEIRFVFREFLSLKVQNALILTFNINFLLKNSLVNSQHAQTNAKGYVYIKIGFNDWV